MANQKELSGRVALVTGAGSGLGKAAALLLAQQGAKVGVLSRTPDEVNRTAQEIKAQGGESIALTADVGQAREVESAVDQTVQWFGRLDIVFANAGVNGVWAPLDELSVDEWDKTIQVNLSGTFYTLKFAAPHLKKQGGSVIITASVNGTRMFSNTGATAYATTKAGQVALTQMLALELAKHKVRVNVICPGKIESEIQENTERRDVEKEQEKVEFPEGKIPLTRGEPGKADDVAELVLFLASDRSKHITGTPIWIDGAESLLKG